MSSLVYSNPESDLTAEKLKVILEKLTSVLKGRVKEVYIFGSASTGDHTVDSDIDLIIVKENVTEPFMHRPLEFKDVYEIWPRIDLLVYSPKELAQQLADSNVGFWESVRLSLKRIV